MILERYLIREIIRPQIPICAVLILIFAGYSAARLLNDAVNGLMPGSTVAALIFLKIVIALEVLLPVTLYFAVIIAFGRLHGDREVVAMEAGGVGPVRIFAGVLLLALPVAGLTALFSLQARPWAYEMSYLLKARARAAFNFQQIEPGRFYELGDDLVFLAQRFDPKRRLASEVYIWEVKDSGRQVTFAREAQQAWDPETGGEILVLRGGHHVGLGGPRSGDRRITFERYLLRLKQVEEVPLEYRRKAARTLQLAESADAEDVAELQWRLSTAPATVLLALLAVPLSRTAPRRGKYAKLTVAVLVFFVYYNLSAVAKNWVEQGVVPPFPGIWWSTALLAWLTVALLAADPASPGGFWQGLRSLGRWVSRHGRSG